MYMQKKTEEKINVHPVILKRLKFILPLIPPVMIAMITLGGWERTVSDMRPYLIAFGIMLGVYIAMVAYRLNQDHSLRCSTRWVILAIV